MPTTLFFTDVVGNESVVKGALILVHNLQFRASGLSSTITALSQELEIVHVYKGTLEARCGTSSWRMVDASFCEALMGADA